MYFLLTQAHNSFNARAHGYGGKTTGCTGAWRLRMGRGEGRGQARRRRNLIN